jgi:hypothetical protein
MVIPPIFKGALMVVFLGWWRMTCLIVTTLYFKKPRNINSRVLLVVVVFIKKFILKNSLVEIFKKTFFEFILVETFYIVI